MAQKEQKQGENDALLGQTDPKSSKKPLFERSKLDKPIAGVESDTGLVPLETLSVNELLEWRASIDKLLPARSLAELDLEEEVLLQFARTKALYDRVAEDSNTPANQRAQVANSCTSILDQLIKMQAKLYGAERVKALEQVLIRVLKTLPEAAQTEFFSRYERALEELGLAKSAPTPTPKEPATK